LENLTHSLVGVALADLVLRRNATKAERRTLVGAGIIAANLPDIDVVYSGITAAPLGYLLHHRGHTHTVLGLAVLAAALVLIYRRLPPIRKARSSERIRLWILIATALASHLLLDFLNPYGVHPFHPIDSTWYYGDAVFIFEPSLWLVLGIAAARNARSRLARFGAGLPIAIGTIALAVWGIILLEALASLAIFGLSFAWMSRQMSPRARSGVAIAMSVLIIAGLVGTSRVARRAATTALQPELRGRLIDAVLMPNPSSPLCWSVIGIELDEAGDEFVLRRGTLSLLPRWKDPTRCAMYRLTGPHQGRLTAGGAFALRDETRQPLRRFRDLAQGDCRIRAWLRFGRAPVMADGAIFDLRFAERFGQNFSLMALAPSREAAPCPSHVPGWGLPRADLLSR